MLFPRKRLLRVLLAAVVFCFLLSTFCFFFRAPLLRAAAWWWIVNDPPAHADAIVVLGGGLDCRPFAAARLYRSGAAPAVLVTQPRLSPTEELGLRAPEQEIARAILLTNGVPATAIQALGTNVFNTRDEALALRAWVEQTKAHSVLIPTDVFHTRRARWIFERALRGTGSQVRMVAVDPPRYTATNWWRVEDGLIAFETEVVKSVYYHLKY